MDLAKDVWRALADTADHEQMSGPLHGSPKVCVRTSGRVLREALLEKGPQVGNSPLRLKNSMPWSHMIGKFLRWPKQQFGTPSFVMM